MPDSHDNPNIVKVMIFGEEYSVKSSDDAEYISNVAEYLDKKMHEIAAKNRNTPPNRIAVLTALNLAGELFDLRKQSSLELTDFENRAKDLIEMLEERIT